MGTPDSVGDSLQRREIAIHVRMAAVDDAADAVRGGGLRFFDHQVDIVCEARGQRPALGGGQRLRQRIADGQVLVEQRRAGDRVGRDVFSRSVRMTAPRGNAAPARPGGCHGAPEVRHQPLFQSPRASLRLSLVMDAYLSPADCRRG